LLNVIQTLYELSWKRLSIITNNYIQKRQSIFRKLFAEFRLKQEMNKIIRMLYWLEPVS